MDASKFLGGAVPVGGITSFTDSLGPDIEIEGKHYIQAGFLKETGFAPFLNGKERAAVSEYAPGNTGVTNADYFLRAYGGDGEGTILVVQSDSSIITRRSTDGGVTWADATIPSNFAPNAIDMNSNGRWIAIGSGGYAISTDGGATFGTLNVLGNNYSHLAAGRNGLWLAATQSLIWRTTDDGVTSSESGGYFGGAFASDLRFNGAGDVCIVPANDGRIWRSDNTGLSFAGAYPVAGFTGWLYSADCDGNGVWVVGGIKGFIARSDDDGLTWTQMDPIDNSGVNIGRVRYVGNGYWIAGRGTEIISSADNGITWTPLAAAPTLDASVGPILRTTGGKVFLMEAGRNRGANHTITLSKGVGLDASLGSTTYMRYK